MEQLLQILRDFLDNVQPLNDQVPQSLNIFVFFLQWAAIILYALSGIYDARKYGMDAYGSLVIGLIVSVGGGTIRDLLLDRHPVFWVDNPAYVITVVVVAVFAVFIFRGKRFELKDSKYSWIYFIIDSLGLGFWAYLGTICALQMHAQPLIAPIMGIITASFGGVIRDVVFSRVPQIFMPGQLYVTAAAIGAMVYELFWWLGISETISFLTCFLLTFTIRIVTVKFNIRTK